MCLFPSTFRKEEKKEVEMFPLVSGNACVECAGTFLWVMKPKIL